jgi:putative hydrolase of the HAD superfamily
MEFDLRFSADIDAVIFDVGGVFTVPSHERIGAELLKVGIEAPALSHASVHRGHFVGIRAFERQNHTTEVMEAVDWENYFQVLLQAVGVSDNDLYEGFVAMKALLAHPTLPEYRPSPWSGVIPENVIGLQRLVAAGVPVGVVSNNDGTAPEQLMAVKVAQVGPGPFTPVSVIIDSGTVGVSKPNPAIFTPALEAMDVAAHRALYVGDTPHADVRGARAAGMPVVQLDPYNLYAGWDHYRVADVGILADLLLR